MSTEMSRETGPTDTDLVRAALSDDTDAFATLYDRYADRIHAFCFSRLRNDADSADALQETFVSAHWRLNQLDEPSQFRPWIFAIARNTIVDIARVRGRHVRRRDWGPIAGGRTPADPHQLGRAADLPEPDHAMIAAESAELLWDTATGLQPREQELLELHLREGLDGDDLARAMAVEPAHLAVMVKRMKARLSSAVGSLLVARLGRRECDDLDALLSGWNGRYSLAIRSTVARHVEFCDSCQQTQRSTAAWESIAAAMPSAPAPAAVRLFVMAEVASGATPTAEPEPTPGLIEPDLPEPDLAEPDLADPDLPEPDVLETAPARDDGGNGGKRGARVGLSGATFASPVKFLAIVVAMTGAVLAWPVVRDNARSDVIVTGAAEVDADVAGESETTDSTTTADVVTTTTLATTSETAPATPAIFFGDSQPMLFPPGVETIDYRFGNVGGTPMSWAASTASPFGVSFPKGTLLPGEAITLRLTFDPMQLFNDDIGALYLETDGGDFDIALLVLPA